MGSRRTGDIVTDWRVVDDSRGETLSDHRYIVITIGTACQRLLRSLRGGGEKRWALTKLDEKLETALRAVTWGLGEGETGRDIVTEVEWLRGTMQRICDESMPRTSSRPRRATYWWTDEIAELRHSSVRARRILSRFPRNGNQEEREEALATYRAARCALSLAIRKSRASCWDEMLASLNTDSWGRPYKIVLKKHRTWAPPATESLDPHILREVVDTLFPCEVEGSTIEWGPNLDGPHEITEELEVSGGEIIRAVRRIGAKKAPGSDGIPGKIWVRALEYLSERLRHTFNECLRQGQFPQHWKRAKLVLLPKEGREPETPSAYRPICLLNEVGKTFERILASRLVQHLCQEGRGLHEEQYDFRKGRSTMDAVGRVRALTEAAMEEGRVAMAISLDIANAFNTLPWNRIRDALQQREVPATSWGYCEITSGTGN